MDDTEQSSTGARDVIADAMSGWARRVVASIENIAELRRHGHLTESYAAPFEVVRDERTFKLRRYLRPASLTANTALAPLLLVPPLMVTSEVYDISPDLSAVQQLLTAGVDVWVCDFGAPEREEGGMTRTLDDHVVAVSRSIDTVRSFTGRDVHLAGYSQGGMFIYQAVALRRSEGVRSIATFGSPVDIRRALPIPISPRAAERLIDVARVVIEKPLTAIEGLPGFITSTAFKVVSVRKEAAQLVDFVKHLHDRETLEKRESRRRFLAGEGFVAWPGPALRQFIDEFIVANRMSSGGFVIDGRTVTLADLTVPILSFYGTRDDIARAPAVRAIRRIATRAKVHEVAVRSGHFGLVVGRAASTTTWPTLVAWMQHLDADGPLPEAASELERSATSTREPARRATDDEAELDELELDLGALLDATRGVVEATRERAARLGKSAGEMVDHLRWQLPRIERLRGIREDTPISLARLLRENARRRPEDTLFLWKGRAFTYRQADERVDNVARGLTTLGVSRGDRVAVWMHVRPTYLSVVGALSRLGAVAVLVPTEADGPPDADAARRAIELADARWVIVDPEHASVGRALGDRTVVSLGGAGHAVLPANVPDLERVDVTNVALPAWTDDARARELAMILFTQGRGRERRLGRLRASRITHRRWAASALGGAAACALTPHDTVFCALPLHHAAGILVAVGSAIAGGARLAIVPRFREETFLDDVHHTGASIVFYAGEMLRGVVERPVAELDASLPVRLFAGSGIPRDVFSKLTTRYPRSRVLDFYASTEGNAVLANTRAQKVGAVGRPLPGSADVRLVDWDVATGAPIREPGGIARLTRRGRPGMLVARIDEVARAGAFDGYDSAADTRARTITDVVDRGDRYFVTGDLMRADEDDDLWFFDREGDVLSRRDGSGELVSTVTLEDTWSTLPGVQRAVALGFGESRTRYAWVLAVSFRDTDPEHARLASALRSLDETLRPDLVAEIGALPLTDGYRVQREVLATDLPDARAFTIDDAALVPAGTLREALEGAGHVARLASLDPSTAR